MVWIDYCILVVIFFTLVRGLWRGALQEMLAVTFLILAPILALWLAPWFADHLVSLITLATLRFQMAFFVLFFAILGIGFFVRYLVGRVSSDEGLSFKSRVWGGLLGLIRGAIWVVLLLILGQHYQLNQTPPWQASTLIPYCDQMTNAGLNRVQNAEAKYDVGLPVAKQVKEKLKN
jgi:membrane protein required for colicin V production